MSLIIKVDRVPLSPLRFPTLAFDGQGRLAQGGWRWAKTRWHCCLRREQQTEDAQRQIDTSRQVRHNRSKHRCEARGAAHHPLCAHIPQRRRDGEKEGKEEGSSRAHRFCLSNCCWPLADHGVIDSCVHQVYAIEVPAGLWNEQMPVRRRRFRPVPSSSMGWGNKGAWFSFLYLAPVSL